MTKLFLIATILFAVFAAALSQSVKSFDFHEWFQGDFTVQTASSKLSDTSLTLDGSYINHYNVAAENGTSALIGTSFNNATETALISNLQNIRVTFEDESKVNGVFLSGESEETLMPLFAFAFQQLDNGILVSQGTWGKEDTYQWMIPAPEKFLLTVYHKSGAVTTFIGKRVPKIVPETFWQKYKMWFMIGGMMLFNTFMQSKAKQFAPQPETVIPSDKKSN